MTQPKNWVLQHPLEKQFLVSFSDNSMSNTSELGEAWISNYDTLRSVQGYINAVHEINYELIELTINRMEQPSNE